MKHLTHCLLAIFLEGALSGMVEAAPLTTSVYVIQNSAVSNQIAAFQQDPATGSLRLIETYSTGGLGRPSVDGNSSHALVARGQHLFAVNSGDHSISAFEILTGGTLKFQGRYASGGYVPVSLAIHRDHLLVLHQGAISEGLHGGISAFRITREGSLQPIPSAHFDYLPGDLPVDILAAPTSDVFGVSRKLAGNVDIFRLSKDGFVLRTDSIGGLQEPYGGAALPERSPGSKRMNLRNFFAITQSKEDQPGVLAFKTSSRGAAQQMNQNIRPQLLDPCWAALHPDGKRLWFSAFARRSLSLYGLEKNGGLEWVSDLAPLDQGPGGLDITISSDGLYLFRLSAFDKKPPFQPTRPYIDTFRIVNQADSADLKRIESLPFPESWSQSSPMGIVAVTRKPGTVQ
jgi:6-phosphogluconolactonase (cycloisomerase 2 family)